MKAIFLRITLLLFCSRVTAEDVIYLDSVNTRYGVVKVTRDEIGQPHRLEYRGKTVFKTEGQQVSIHGYMADRTRDVVLFGVNCGGSSCAPDELHFLVLSHKSKPLAISNDNFESNDATMKLFKKNGLVRVDLGFENGKRKFAELKSDRIEIKYYSQGALSMKDEDCKWIYEQSSQSCAQGNEIKGSCVSMSETVLSATAMNGLRALSNHPGYVSSEWYKSCTTWCNGGQIVYDDFKKSVCSIKTP